LQRKNLGAWPRIKIFAQKKIVLNQEGARIGKKYIRSILGVN
jgi:hypothetical protein